VEPAKPLSVDDIYENPDEAIRRVAKEELSSEVTELRETIAEMKQERIVADMEEKYPGWLNVSQSPEFAAWCNESPYRQRMVMDVRSNGDLAAAQELLGMYYDQHPQGEENETETAEQLAAKQQQLRNATLESSGPAPVDSTDTYSRSDLLDARLAAKAGDQKAQRWLAANSEAISAAYSEGRIVD
jgi:hypothetical protein